VLAGSNQEKEKSAAVFAVRRANYTHRRKGVFNVQNYRGSASDWQCSLPHQGDTKTLSNNFFFRRHLLLLRAQISFLC
jgi:hypothetical protein